MKVFVYGSLKRGYFNHGMIRNSEFICEAKTLDRDYDMINLGSFPAMVNKGNYNISGEVYKVSKGVLEYLDRLEGNGSFYIREKIKVYPIDKSPPAWFYAWAYILPHQYNFKKNTIPCDGLNTKSWAE